MRFSLLLAFLLTLVTAPFTVAQEGPSTLTCPSETGREATFVIHVDDGLSLPLQDGWIVVSTPSAACVGQAAWHPALRTVTIHGDDPVTPDVDGAQPGEALSLHLYDAAGMRLDVSVTPTMSESSCVACQDDFVYQHDALFVASQIEANTSTAVEPIADFATPTVQALYPNPTRELATVEIGLPATEHVRIVLFDLLGREVRRVHDDVLPAGLTQTRVETRGLASGNYLLRVEAESFVETRSLIVVE